MKRAVVAVLVGALVSVLGGMARADEDPVGVWVNEGDGWWSVTSYDVSVAGGVNNGIHYGCEYVGVGLDLPGRIASLVVVSPSNDGLVNTSLYYFDPPDRVVVIKICDAMEG